jgi:hypothetical protein
MNALKMMFRSRVKGHRMLSGKAIVLIGLITLCVPAILGGIAASFVALVDQYFVSIRDSIDAVGVFALILVFSPIYGIVLVPLGMCIMGVAMRFGYAGWATAMLTAGVGCFVFVAVQSGPISQLSRLYAEALLFVPICVIYATIMWCSALWICPDALRARHD